MRSLVAALLLVPLVADGGPADADRAFAAQAAVDGVNAAFLAVLAEDGTLFRPQPVPGRAWMREHPDDGLLAWEPRVEWLSAAGDLGVTLGPWTYTKDERELGAGHFLSVWKRAEGRWRLVGDIGVAHAAPGTPFDAAAPALAAPDAREVGSEAAIDELRAAEAALSAAQAEAGALALLDAAHERIVLLRNGVPPTIGTEAAATLLESDAPSTTALLGRVTVARSADLAATWGALAPEAEGGARGGWLRVWRRDGEGPWRVLADVRLPAP